VIRGERGVGVKDVWGKVSTVLKGVGRWPRRMGSSTDSAATHVRK
jgi:hypothetical protein